MPRVAETRLPAIPSTAGQKERYQRILRAAAEHGAANGLERIQMLDIAKDAGVAIATLYRYFPSKTVLFTALLHSQVDRLDQMVSMRTNGREPQEAIADVLVQAGRRLLSRPLLAHAMLTSNNAAVAGDVPSMAVTGVFADLILKVGHIERPSPHDMRLVRLIEQTWYGVLISELNGHISAVEADADTRLACRLLLTDLGRS
ncbi:TetR family transcriptional regulator [Nocardioides sambongensis]|uniref:TetR family transcriptional regulator n=1 Tax=Nocardioides sambongensis TaxID=2589074 RepID=UPI00112AFF0A|nr:TetR family transcriptional regulator [Nocardioides sambongensis]